MILKMILKKRIGRRRGTCINASERCSIGYIHRGLILDYFSIPRRPGLNTQTHGTCKERERERERERDTRGRRYRGPARGTMLQIYNEKKTSSAYTASRARESSPQSVPTLVDTFYEYITHVTRQTFGNFITTEVCTCVRICVVRAYREFLRVYREFLELSIQHLRSFFMD